MKPFADVYLVEDRLEDDRVLCDFAGWFMRLANARLRFPPCLMTPAPKSNHACYLTAIDDGLMTIRRHARPRGRRGVNY